MQPCDLNGWLHFLMLLIFMQITISVDYVAFYLCRFLTSDQCNKIFFFIGTFLYGQFRRAFSSFIEVSLSLKWGGADLMAVGKVTWSIPLGIVDFWSITYNGNRRRHFLITDYGIIKTN